MKNRTFHLITVILVFLLALGDNLVSSVKMVHADQRGAVDLNRLMWLGAGAGSKGIAAGLVSGVAPEAGIAPEVGSALIGFWLSNQGGARMGPFGEGLLIAAIGQLVRQPIEGLVGKFLKPGAETPEGTPEKAPAASEESLDTYLATTYGIV